MNRQSRRIGFAARGGRKRHAVQQHAAAIGREHAREQIHGGRFAGAILAHDPEHRARRS